MKKTFDAVGWMRKRRIEIDRETESLSWEERSQYINNSLRGDPLWARIKDRTPPISRRATMQHVSTVQESPGDYSAGAKKLR